MNTTLLILLGVVVLLGGFFVALYNGLIRLRNKVDEAWSDIDVQLKRRYDLIPNIVEAVKGYAKQEKSVFTEVTKARAEAMKAEGAAAESRAENALSETLKSLFAVAESYPELKSNTNFLDLQKQLSEVEENIQKSRRYYNGNVRDFNTKIQVFPNNLFANMLGFGKYEFFQAEEGEKENVKVNF
jgi:LemA protein